MRGARAEIGGSPALLEKYYIAGPGARARAAELERIRTEMHLPGLSRSDSRVRAVIARESPFDSTLLHAARLEKKA